VLAAASSVSMFAASTSGDKIAQGIDDTLGCYISDCVLTVTVFIVHLIAVPQTVG